MKDPENLDEMLRGGGEIWDEMYDWGHHKFMGTVDPNQQIEVKKSARQIYAEAFMDDENPMYRRSTHFADYADEDALREQYEEEMKLTEEERARKKLDELLDEDDEDAAGQEAASETAESQESVKDAEDSEGEAASEAADDEESAEDLLDKLTGNFDDDEEEEEKAATEATEEPVKEAGTKFEQEETKESEPEKKEPKQKGKTQAELDKEIQDNLKKIKEEEEEAMQRMKKE